MLYTAMADNQLNVRVPPLHCFSTKLEHSELRICWHIFPVGSAACHYIFLIIAWAQETPPDLLFARVCVGLSHCGCLVSKKKQKQKRNTTIYL